MTLLITPISASDVRVMIDRARQALTEGADAVELRLDALEEAGPELSKLVTTLPRGQWIATCRSREEGGDSSLEPGRRWELLRSMAAGGAGYIDFELASAGAVNLHAVRSAGLILSAHDFAARPAEPARILANMQAAAPEAVGKIAWATDDINDNFDALALLREAPGRRLVICMGEKGLLSRVLAGKFAAFGTFCTSRDAEATAPGQLPLADMRNVYRFKRLTGRSRVFGVIGAPVAHSLSPVVFNALFEADGVDAVYLPLRVDSDDELKRFLSGCLEHTWLDVGGFSVTIPHKATALEWAGSSADSAARRIGSANTLVLEDGTARAFNTDYIGAVAAIEAGGVELRGRRAAVLGAGGVARAVVAGLCDRGCSVTIYNRSADRARALAEDFDCVAEAWDKRTDSTADLMVNCTSLGMWPAVDETPLPAGTLRAGMTVFDTIYNPIDTRLLREASRAGCKVINGVAMFVRQAAAQYQIWTGREADADVMTRIATERLGSASASSAEGPA